MTYGRIGLMRSRIMNRVRKLSARIVPREVLPVVRDVNQSEWFLGKTIWIMGGTGGIGRAIAAELCAGGGHLVLIGTNENRLQRTASELEANRSRVNWAMVDLLSVNDLPEALRKTAGMYGVPDVFINSSGVHTEGADFWTMEPHEYDRVMNVNLRGVYFAAREVARMMIDHRIHGRILFVGSSRGFEPAWSPYGMSKWALRGLTEGMAKLLVSEGITVNAIAPGSTATPLIGVEPGQSVASSENGLGRLATPEEVAAWAKMLVGPQGGFVSGETLLVSAGRGRFDVR